MNAFFKKYDLHLRALKIILLSGWIMFKFYQFNQGKKEINLLGVIIIVAMIAILIFDFYQRYRRVKDQNHKIQHL